jgi:hypothetical protein
MSGAFGDHEPSLLVVVGIPSSGASSTVTGTHATVSARRLASSSGHFMLGLRCCDVT